MPETPHSNPTILVVDDSRLIRLAARKILNGHFEVIEAEDGLAAWEILQQNRPISLVMSDLSMPNLDGLGLLARIRDAEGPLRTLPVIILTGAEDDDGSKETAFSAGASDFITKPFESAKLLARAQVHVKQQNTQQALQKSEETNQVLTKSASTDALTGLLNASSFNDRVEEGLSYATRHRTNISVLQIRIDKYKIIFLRRGKPTAEQVLQQVSQALKPSRRREDIIGRIGMDTFGIILPSSNQEGAALIAEQIRTTLEGLTITTNNEPVRVTVSISVSSQTMHTQISREQLLLAGEARLKQAKENGGNCVQLSQPAPSTQQAAPPVVSQPASIEKQQPENLTSQAQAALPLFRAWNQARGNRYSDLIEQLASALMEDHDEPTKEKSRSTLESA